MSMPSTFSSKYLQVWNISTCKTPWAYMHMSNLLVVPPYNWYKSPTSCLYLALWVSDIAVTLTNKLHRYRCLCSTLPQYTLYWLPHFILWLKISPLASIFNRVASVGSHNSSHQQATQVPLHISIYTIPHNICHSYEFHICGLSVGNEGCVGHLSYYIMLLHKGM